MTRTHNNLLRLEAPILIVEDSATQRELLRHALENHQFQVKHATNGAEALQQLASMTPALVISDVLMPEMDGFELCRRIKTTSAWKKIPVILLTALQDPKDIICGLECGADSFIVKPLEESYLLSRIKDILANPPGEPSATPPNPVEITWQGKPYEVRSDRRQILGLLLSSYEAAIRKNNQLLNAQEQLRAANFDLEHKVKQRTAKLEEANQSLESFCYSIAHDLRAPLRAIQGFTSLLLAEYGRHYDTAGQNYANRVINAALQMDKLIQDLLSYGRVSHLDFPTQQIDLGDSLESALRQVNDEIKKTQADIRIDRPLPEVKGNDVLLQQVLVNLISNALKFVKPGEHPILHIWGDRVDSRVRLNIRDFGIGIDAAYSERIFRIFERLHASEKYPGTGIGLVIVRKGVERMGGKVGFESKPGEGTRFWIELPKS